LGIKKLLVPAIASILILGTPGILQSVYAGSGFAIDDTPPFYRNLDCTFFAIFYDQSDGVIESDPSNLPLDFHDLPCSFTFQGDDPSVDCAVVGVTALNSQPGLLCSFFIPNFIDPLPTKNLRIQTSFLGSAPMTYSVLAHDGTASPIPCTMITHQDLDSTDGDGYWIEDWECLPNPDSEWIDIFIPQGTDIIGIIFDTWSFSRSPVGGDMIQMQTTSVLAAGAQYTAAWMIPVIISAIGIGIVIARKF